MGFMRIARSSVQPSCSCRDAIAPDDPITRAAAKLMQYAKIDALIQLDRDRCQRRGASIGAIVPCQQHRSRQAAQGLR
jgi:hypothetical protein